MLEIAGTSELFTEHFGSLGLQLRLTPSIEHVPSWPASPGVTSVTSNPFQ